MSRRDAEDPAEPRDGSSPRTDASPQGPDSVRRTHPGADRYSGDPNTRVPEGRPDPRHPFNGPPHPPAPPGPSGPQVPQGPRPSHGPSGPVGPQGPQGPFGHQRPGPPPAGEAPPRRQGDGAPPRRYTSPSGPQVPPGSSGPQHPWAGPHTVRTPPSGQVPPRPGPRAPSGPPRARANDSIAEAFLSGTSGMPAPPVPESPRETPAPRPRPPHRVAPPNGPGRTPPPNPYPWHGPGPEQTSPPGALRNTPPRGPVPPAVAAAPEPATVGPEAPARPVASERSEQRPRPKDEAESSGVDSESFASSTFDPVPSAKGMEAWADIVDRTPPMPGGFEERIVNVRAVPASLFGRALFRVSFGRIKVG